MAIVRQALVYQGPGGPFEGVLAYEDEVATLRPGVLVLPNVLGQKEADNVHAENLAKLGYVALACDVYGQGKRTTHASANRTEYMDALNADRGMLRDRLRASLDALAGFDRVDPARLAAIGFCFGGKCVLDLARSGADISGGVSLHGVYDPPPFPHSRITAKLLICHGWDDPLGPPDMTAALARELTEAGCDWQLHAYGHTGHAFTDHSADMPDKGLLYSPDADRRSFRAMVDFLGDLFG